MKIAIIGWGHVDGVLPLVNELVKKRLPITLYLLFDQKNKVDSIIDFRSIQVNNGFLKPTLVKKILGKRILTILNKRIKIKIFILNSPKLYDLKNLILLYDLSRQINQNKFDVININGNNIMESILHFLLRRIPRVHTIHDPVPHSGEGGRFAFQRNKLLSIINSEFIFHANSLSEQFERFYDANPNKIHTVMNGSKEFYRLFNNHNNNKSLEPVILFYGRIVQYKGIEYLVKAIKLIKKNNDNIKLIIAGSGNFYFDINELINDRNFIIINRYINDEELVQLINQAWLVVCPYTDATQSGVVLTSYAFNTPVVATNVGGIPEVVIDNETGVLVPPKNSQALAEALTNLINNKEEISRMEKNIEQIKKDGNISWNKIANQTLKVYQKAIRSS